MSAAVVTVPAYFDASQRNATKAACLLAGLERVRLLREPEAAALTYALDVRGDERVMVFDLGGGTFDVSIVDVGGGVVEVIATSGDPRVGGNDWDLVITDWLEAQYRAQVAVVSMATVSVAWPVPHAARRAPSLPCTCYIRHAHTCTCTCYSHAHVPCTLHPAQHGVPLRGLAYRRVLDAAVEAKHALSLHATTVIEVPFLDGERGLGPITLSRRKFEALCRPLLLKLVPPLKEAMELAGLELQQDIGTLEMGDASHLPPSRQQWQRQVAWRWRRMAKKAGVSSEQACDPT